MENSSLINLSTPDRERIDYGAYTTSLVQEALRVGALDDAAMTRVGDGLLSLLRAQLGKAAHGESTSAPTEAADALMDGIGYCVDLALRAAASVEESIVLLQTCSIETLYQRGAKLLNERANACSALLSRVRATRTKTVNTGYRIALDQSLPVLLREWGGDPFPHDFAVILEYPLAIEDKQSGIPGVYAYLAAFALENRFCAHFSDGLDTLLADYARQNRATPADAYVNLFTIALQNLLLCGLLRRDGMTLFATDVDTLQDKLAALSPSLREQAILYVTDTLLAACAFENERLDAYVRAAACQFSASITAHNLTALAVISRADAPLQHTDGARMSDDAFLDVANEILLCDSVASKIRILRDEVRSLDDLCDLLDADCVFDDEFPAVFASFDAATAALLLTRASADLKDGVLLPQTETEWQLRLIRFVNGLGAEPRGALLQTYRLLAGL